MTDNITFDNYMEENSQAKTPGTTGETAVNEDGKPTKHNIYILTKKRETKIEPNVEAFLRKPLDLSNVSLILSSSIATNRLDRKSRLRDSLNWSAFGLQFHQQQLGSRRRWKCHVSPFLLLIYRF